MDTTKEQLAKDVARLKQQLADFADLKQQVAKLREELAAHTHAAPAEVPPVPAPSTKKRWGEKK